MYCVIWRVQCLIVFVDIMCLLHIMSFVMCTGDDMRQCDISVATFRQQVYWARPEYNRVYKWIFDRFLFLFIPIEIATQITIMNNDGPNLSQIRDSSHHHFILAPEGALYPEISDPTTHSLRCYIGLKRKYFVINFICRFHTTKVPKSQTIQPNSACRRLVRTKFL